MDIIGILPSSLLLAIVGATDNVAVVLNNQQQFASRWFLAKWANVACLMHFSLKLLAGTLNGLSALLVIDIFALILTALVTRTSFRELSHTKKSFQAGSGDHFSVHPISENSLQTWLPLAAVCALDAYPLGHFKEALSKEDFGLKIDVGYVLSSVAVGAITYAIGRITRRLEKRIRQPKHAFVFLTRTLHGLVCSTMAIVLSLDLVLVLLGAIFPELSGKTALKTNTILTSGLISCLILSWLYGEIIKVAWDLHRRRKNAAGSLPGS